MVIAFPIEERGSYDILGGFDPEVRNPGGRGTRRDVRQRTPTEILTAIGMTERVSAFLAGYAERDAAIELLADDVAVNRLRLIEDLRTFFLPHTRRALRAAR
jgi:hypothetical protein